MHESIWRPGIGKKHIQRKPRQSFQCPILEYHACLERFALGKQSLETHWSAEIKIAEELATRYYEYRDDRDDEMVKIAKEIIAGRRRLVQTITNLHKKMLVVYTSAPPRFSHKQKLNLVSTDLWNTFQEQMDLHLQIKQKLKRVKDCRKVSNCT